MWPALLVVLAVACDREPEPLPELGPDDDFCNTISYACLEGSRTDTADGCPDLGGPPAIDFASDVSTLDAEAERVLEDIARDVRRYTLSPGVVLHLVSTGPEGELARARLEAVRAGLSARGVPAGRLTTYGTAQGLADGPSVLVVAEGCAAR